MNERTTPIKQNDECFCTECGSIVKLKAIICMSCGVALEAKEAKEKPSGSKSKTTAVLLALFLGGLGGHKFYLGKTVQGFLYLLFCWTFIPAIIAIIDIIVLLVMQDDEFHSKYP
ncbi:NINE protein [Vibrio chagasii]|nr:NINE protein [Vibrio chagasii]